MIIRKIISILIIGMAMVTNSYATDPFPNEEYVSDSGRYKVVLHPIWRGEPQSEDSLVLSDKKEDKKHSFSVEQLGLDSNHPNMWPSTAGTWWYRNSIAVFDQQERFFVIKLPWPRYVVIDLEKHVIVQGSSEELLQEANRLISSLALKWLDSEDAYKRQTGAIVCKDLKISESIPRLKDLLNDKEFYMTSVGSKDNKIFILFYARKAAEEALIALGEPVGKIITELPEECLVEKDYRYVIDWGNKKCQGIK